LSRATLLAHPDPSAPLALVTDASTSAMGAVLQQRVNSAWQPLAFFSRKLSPAQQKYSAYDRVACHLRGREEFPTHAGSAPLHHIHRSQAHHVRLPADEGQMLTAAIQPPRFCVPVHNRHKTHLWTSSLTPSRASSPSLQRRLTTNRKTATTSYEHSWGQQPPCSSRSN
jgi:hypothetical protein